MANKITTPDGTPAKYVVKPLKAKKAAAKPAAKKTPGKKAK